MFSFRLGPFPVTVYPHFFLGAVLLGSGLGFGWQMLVWIGVVFVSIVAHELGHAVVARLFGGAPEIQVQMMGGLTYPQFPVAPTPGRQFLLSLAGPVAGLALGAAAFGLTQVMPAAPGSPSALAMYFFIRTSVIWAVFNLLPVLPLDGGQMMLAVLEGVRRKPSVTLASWISVAVTVLAAVAYAFLYGPTPWTLLWFGYFAFVNFTRARASARVGPRPAQAPPIDPLEQADIARSLEAAGEALTRSDYDAALEVARSLEAAGGPPRQAAALRVRAGVELVRGDHETSALLAGQSFSIVQSPEAALVAARANLRSGHRERAATWLRRAAEAGVALDAIRADPELSALDPA